MVGPDVRARRQVVQNQIRPVGSVEPADFQPLVPEECYRNMILVRKRSRLLVDCRRLDRLCGAEVLYSEGYVWVVRRHGNRGGRSLYPGGGGLRPRDCFAASNHQQCHQARC